jgi:hypothetical protein
MSSQPASKTTILSEAPETGMFTKEFLTAKTKKLNFELAGDFETLSKAAEAIQ